MNEKHRHHYVPQGYLRGFTIPGEKSLLWEYDTKTGEVSSCPKSVRSVCFRIDHNLLEWRDGRRDPNLVEDWLDKNIEAPALTVIKEFKVEPGQTRVGMPDTQKETLGRFVAFLLARVPMFRDGVEEDTQWIAETMLRMDVELGNLKLPPNTTCRVNVTHGSSVPAMMRGATLGTKVLMKKKWVFVAAQTGHYFLTSDSPVGVGARHALVGPFHPESTVFLSLRKDLSLLALPDCGDNGFVHTRYFDADKTRDFNALIVRNADRFVYGSEKNPEVLKLMAKTVP